MSTPNRALVLFCQLARRDGRRAAADALARELHAEALFVFVPDPEVRALVPAPGFAPTYPGGPGWAALLARCGVPGRVEGEVEYPDQRRRVRAQAVVTEPGMVFLLVGADAVLPDPETLALPLLASTLLAEADADAQRGRMAVERETARYATALAATLDRTRQEVQAALAESARLNEALNRAAEERARLLESEQQANRAKDEFLAMLGHELRNPLAPIVTALQVLRLRGGQQFGREHALIERQVRHLVRLVDDLLDVARITRGKVTLVRAPVELGTVVSRAAEMVSPLLEERQHRLVVEVPPSGLCVNGDEERLVQVVSNLLSNAARYTPPGGVVEVRGVREDGRVCLSVKDSGIGIEPDVLDDVFELFVQGPRAKDRRAGGLGLGLAIVSNLVALHGGAVTAHSAGPGHGAEFRVELPAMAADAAGEKAATRETHPSSPAHRKARKVLVVDDNLDAAELLGEALQLEGYEVRVCHDGPAALAEVERFVPDVAVLDLGLPVMDGLELARHLRARPELAGTRLIAATGYGQESDVAATRAAGFEHHLVKPLSLSQVIALIEGQAPADGQALL